MNEYRAMSAERAAEIKAREIDYSDIPEITDLSRSWLRRDRLSGKIKPRLEKGEDGKFHTVFD